MALQGYVPQEVTATAEAHTDPLVQGLTIGCRGMYIATQLNEQFAATEEQRITAMQAELS
jgi:hypothetical protein